MSFPAIMPVSNPCCLHVVLHPKGNPVQHQVPCLMDLRRVHAADRPAWEVSLLPPCCSLADLQAHFSHFFPTLQAYSRQLSEAAGPANRLAATLCRHRPWHAPCRRSGHDA